MLLLEDSCLSPVFFVHFEMGKGVDPSKKRDKRKEQRAIQIQISEESRLRQVHHYSWYDLLNPMNEDMGFGILGIGTGADQQLGDALHRQHMPGDADLPLDRPDEVVPPLGQPAPPGPAPERPAPPGPALPGPGLAPEEAALPLGLPGGPAPPGPDEVAPPLGRPGGPAPYRRGLAPERPAPLGPEESGLPLDRPDGPAPPDAPAHLGAAPHGGPAHRIDQVLYSSVHAFLAYFRLGLDEVQTFF